MVQAQQIQFKTLNLDKPILEKAKDVLDILTHVTGCNADSRFDKFKTIDDIMAVLLDPDAFNEYASACAPSAQEFLQAIALMASLCYYSVATDTGVNKTICSKFFQALGEFVVSRDARSFLILDPNPNYSD